MLIIVLAVSLGVGVGYFTTQRQLDVLINKLSSDEADEVTQKLSQAYTSAGGWSTLDVALSETGYNYDDSFEHERSTTSTSEHESERDEDEAEGDEDEAERDEDEAERDEDEAERDEDEAEGTIHLDRIRIVIVDTQGIVLRDNFSTLVPGVVTPDLTGQRTTIVDLSSGQPVGYAYIDVDRAFLASEELGFLRGLLYSSVIGGLVIAALALLLAVWMSKRVTAPVTALTQAAQSIAERGDTALLPVNSTDELGQMSRAFNHMTTALQTQRDLRKRLLNDVSHELNTPLSVVQLEAHGLSKGLQTPEETAKHIIDEVDTLRNLVRDLNWLAETDTGELELNFAPSSIRQLLVNEVARWQPQANVLQITLSLQSSSTLPNLQLDELRMSQALGNVVHNALQHTEPDGHITVATTIENGKRVRISVIDDGVGLDAADLSHIFDRFYRADQSRNRRTGGVGLGLAIARAIIEAHNGTIGAISDGPGKGATVWFVLPINSVSKTG